MNTRTNHRPNSVQAMERWRNLGIIAHIDAGKTTLTERILWKTGEIHRTGEVHDGNTTMDFGDLEREKGITITAAATQAHWHSARHPDHRLAPGRRRSLHRHLRPGRPGAVDLGRRRQRDGAPVDR